MISPGIFFFSSRRKEKKKNHREKKKCREGKELSFKLSLCPLTFGSCFYPPTFALLFQTFSPGIFFFSIIKKKKKKKGQKEEKKCRE
jgi:hypothetical protein